MASLHYVKFALINCRYRRHKLALYQTSSFFERSLYLFWEFVHELKLSWVNKRGFS